MARARSPDAVVLDTDDLRLYTPNTMQKALRRTPSHKAAGPGGVLGLILKHMSPALHEAIHLLFQSMAITGITPPSWLKSHTILLYKKETLSG
jgi:hypothetical protein